MFNFEMIFSRYRNGIRFNSFPLVKMCPSIDAALDYANGRCAGMKDGDPDPKAEYTLISIKQLGVGGESSEGPELFAEQIPF